MEASLAVPTATSVRTVPAKLLEVNRSMLNQHLARTSGAKVSFTHLIGYAVVQALQAVPALNASLRRPSRRKGHSRGDPPRPRRPRSGRRREKCDGTRTLLVPVIRDAESLDFRAFVVAYEDLVRKVHTQKVTADDFAGATVTLTNPGTLGTVQSVPRLMPGQGAIIGVGSLGFPAEFQAADRRSLAALGVGPVVTLTSTYDHRIIQGAESGMFLTYMAECLTGRHGFYETCSPPWTCPTSRCGGRPTSTPSTASTSVWSSRSGCRAWSTCTGSGAISSPTSIRCRPSPGTCTPSSTPPPTD